MLQQKSQGIRNANSKLFRLAISGLIAAGTALGANAIGAIALTNPHNIYSNPALALDVGETVIAKAN